MPHRWGLLAPDIWIAEPFYGRERIEAFLEEAGASSDGPARVLRPASSRTQSRAVVPEFTREFQHIVVDLPVPPRAKRSFCC